MNKWKLNNNGVTLVELLATLAIVGVVAALAYTVLFQGYSNYERIKTESELRDEADLIMASFIKELFVLKETDVKALKLVCTDGSPDSFLDIAKKGSTGFKEGGIIVKGNPIQFDNDNVSLVPNECNGNTENQHNYITTSESQYGREYTIHFKLTTKYRGTERQMSFENSISIIKNKGGNTGNETNP